MNRSGCTDCAPTGAQPGISHFDATGGYQNDRPFPPFATSPDVTPDSPLQADSPDEPSNPEFNDSAGSTDEPPDPEVLASRLEARGGRITRDELASVISIDLSSADIIDADLEQLHLFRVLKRLNLSGTRISNAGIRHLTTVEQLEYLGVTGTQLDDAAMGTIAKLRGLRFLSLAGTDVTDTGLEALSGMRNLEAINLRSTLVSAEGVAALQAGMPDCRIIFEARSEPPRPVRGPLNRPASADEPVTETGTETSWQMNDRRSGSGRVRTDIRAVPDENLNLARMYPTPEYNAAHRRLELVLRKKLSDPELLHALAAVRAAEGNWPEARTTIRTALEQRPDDAGLRFDFAVTLAQCHELEAAFNEFERAVGRPAAHYNLGVLLVEKQRFAAGRRHLQEAIHLDPTLDAARDWLAYTDGERVDSPLDSGGHGLLSNEQLRSLFGSLMNGDSRPYGEIEIRPGVATHANADQPSVRRTSAAAGPRPVRTESARDW